MHNAAQRLERSAKVRSGVCWQDRGKAGKSTLRLRACFRLAQARGAPADLDNKCRAIIYMDRRPRAFVYRSRFATLLHPGPCLCVCKIAYGLETDVSRLRGRVAEPASLFGPARRWLRSSGRSAFDPARPCRLAAATLVHPQRRKQLSESGSWPATSPPNSTVAPVWG